VDKTVDYVDKIQNMPISMCGLLKKTVDNLWIVLINPVEKYFAELCKLIK
jgi:hypothetical protein